MFSRPKNKIWLGIEENNVCLKPMSLMTAKSKEDVMKTEFIKKIKQFSWKEFVNDKDKYLGWTMLEHDCDCGFAPEQKILDIYKEDKEEGDISIILKGEEYHYKFNPNHASIFVEEKKVNIHVRYMGTVQLIKKLED